MIQQIDKVSKIQNEIPMTHRALAVADRSARSPQVIDETAPYYFAPFFRQFNLPDHIPPINFPWLVITHTHLTLKTRQAG